MSDKLSIVIPTKGRPNDILTNVGGQILVVDKSEEDVYKTANPNAEICICPDFTSLGKKRNWIVEHFENVFMLDDDIVTVVRLYDDAESTVVNSEYQRTIIEKCYDQAKDIGAFLFGFNNDPTPAHYNAMKPFVLNGYINGSAIGIIKGGNLKFSDKIVTADSHYINLLNTHVNRYNFIDKRYCFKQQKGSTFLKDGGQTLNRTLESEKKDTLLLRLTFGEAVILKKKKNKTLQTHQYQRQIKQII